MMDVRMFRSASQAVIQIRRHALVRYSPAQMFELVNDVEAYPTRFPWCADAKIVERESDTALVARLDLKFAGLTQSFTTRNTMNPPHSLHLHLVEGPLHSLEGEWTFEALGKSSSDPSYKREGRSERPPAAQSVSGCKISLALDFEYAGFLVGQALRLGFQGVANRMVDDFCRAAVKAYG
jgi:ribosome-associated toxin RatA of RatAB toxin-antitoxin module